MLKKLLSLFLVTMLLMSFTGCASRNAATQSNAVSSDTTTQSNTVSGDTTTQSSTESSNTTTQSNAVSSDTTTKSNAVSSDTTTKSNTASSGSTTISNTASSDNTTIKSDAIASSTIKSNTVSGDSTSDTMPVVEVRFGIGGKTFNLNLDNNDTAAELARNIGEAGRNLPIYHFNDFENYEVMQYYDIPRSYSIPSNPETFTSEKAGEVYYSAPNRVIIFYQDAEVKGEFTKVGSLENTDGLKAAVENNAVLEGWGNKVIIVNYKE